jgi:multidrug transporter EmrE-like cation transporter
MPYSALDCLAKPLLKNALRWAALSFALNLVWEIAQFPLYTLTADQNRLGVAYAVMHCTVGDVIIAVASFLLAGFALRDPDWTSSRPWTGGAIATAFGSIYTAYSEWVNVYQAGSWGYAPDMPLVFGIGVSPLLQWLVVPLLTLSILRMRAHRGAMLS